MDLRHWGTLSQVPRFLSVIEVLTTSLTTIWFVVSALLALFVSLITDNLFIQFGIFSVIGVLLLIFTKPTLTRLLKTKQEKTNLDRIIGMKGIVIKDITPITNGEVKVDGKVWTAISSDNLKEGDIVEVLEINSVKLKVKKGDDK